jgi:hypothetical protein
MLATLPEFPPTMPKGPANYAFAFRAACGLKLSSLKGYKDLAKLPLIAKVFALIAKVFANPYGNSSYDIGSKRWNVLACVFSPAGRQPALRGAGG